MGNGETIAAVERTEDARDEDIVARVLRGDTNAFGVLVARHTRLVYAIALAHLRDADDAEDAAQDAFVRAYTRLHQCDEPRRFVHWLARIARNVALNRTTDRYRRSAQPLDVVAHVASTETASDDLTRSRQQTRLRDALTQLNPKQREALLLYDMEGYDHREVADILGTSTFMARRYVSTGRKRMRELLGERDI